MGSRRELATPRRALRELERGRCHPPTSVGKLSPGEDGTPGQNATDPTEGDGPANGQTPERAQGLTRGGKTIRLRGRLDRALWSKVCWASATPRRRARPGGVGGTGGRRGNCVFNGPPSAGFFNLPAASGEECPFRKVFVRLEAGVSPKLAGGTRGGRTGGAPGESHPSRGRARLTRAGCSCVHAPGGRVGTRFAGGFLVVLAEVACLSPDGPCCDRAASLSISGPGEQSQESLLKANGAAGRNLGRSPLPLPVSPLRSTNFGSSRRDDSAAEWTHGGPPTGSCCRPQGHCWAGSPAPPGHVTPSKAEPHPRCLPCSWLRGAEPSISQTRRLDAAPLALPLPSGSWLLTQGGANSARSLSLPGSGDTQRGPHSRGSARGKQPLS